MDVNCQNIVRARATVYRYLKPTPLIHYPLLSSRLGFEAYIKHENHNPTGAFKIRGGVNLISNLGADEGRQGVITASTGNHGQSIALACRWNGIPCRIAVPRENNPEKNAAMRAFGAELIVQGKDFDEAREAAERIHQESGVRYVHSGNEPMLICGVGTYALEILEELPFPDYIFVPLGGGSGLAGTLTVIKSMAPRVKVIGVQAERAPAVYLSWKEGKMITTETAQTMADGLATRVPFELPFSIIQRRVDEIITVSEEELEAAIFLLFKSTHNVAEGAGAAATAAAFKYRDHLKGKKVVLIMSGCNIRTSLLLRILQEHSSLEAGERHQNDAAGEAAATPQSQTL